MRINTPLPAQPGWKRQSTKELFRPVRRRFRDDDGVVTAFRDGEVTLRENRRTEGFTNAIAELGYHGVRRGDLVIHSMDAFAGAIGVSDSDGKASPVVHVYESLDGNDPGFFAYVLRELARSGFIASLARGIRERSTAFDSSTFRSLVIAAPPQQEQRRIAQFLDRETARIDAVIARRRYMLVLLKERRRALIADEIEPSGPAEALRLSRLFFIVNGGTPTADPKYWNGVVPWATPIDLGPADGGILRGTRRSLTEAGVQTGSATIGEEALLISTRAPIGYVARVGQRTAFNQGCRGLVPRDSVDLRYFAYQLEGLRSRLEALGQGSTFMELSANELASVPLRNPPLPEQREIADRLDRATREVGVLAMKTARQVEVLVERRQALIAHAVTGQLPRPE